MVRSAEGWAELRAEHGADEGEIICSEDDHRTPRNGTVGAYWVAYDDGEPGRDSLRDELVLVEAALLQGLIRVVNLIPATTPGHSAINSYGRQLPFHPDCSSQR